MYVHLPTSFDVVSTADEGRERLNPAREKIKAPYGGPCIKRKK